MRTKKLCYLKLHYCYRNMGFTLPPIHLEYQMWQDHRSNLYRTGMLPMWRQEGHHWSPEPFTQDWNVCLLAKLELCCVLILSMAPSEFWLYLCTPCGPVKISSLWCLCRLKSQLLSFSSSFLRVWSLKLDQCWSDWLEFLQRYPSIQALTNTFQG